MNEPPLPKFEDAPIFRGARAFQYGVLLTLICLWRSRRHHSDSTEPPPLLGPLCGPYTDYFASSQGLFQCRHILIAECRVFFQTTENDLLKVRRHGALELGAG